MAKIFIGVAWPYANNVQHFGHVAGVYLPADIFARYHRMIGDEVLMVSGSDMHGTPVTVAAEKEGVSPAEIALRYHAINSKSLADFGISYDLFTHTSTPEHAQAVHEVFEKLHKNGSLYLAKMKSAYCPKCARFLPDRYVEGNCPHCGKEGARGDQCDSCGKLLDPEELQGARCKICASPSEIRESEHFFLRLSAFEERLKKFIEDKDFWKDNVLKFTRNILAQGLKDRAVTRDIEYGVPIPLPHFNKKRIYVWFEAVCGYFSASRAWAKHSGNPDAWKDFWEDPACMHYYFLGKDNIMFHTIIWPSILLGYGGLNLPRGVPANDHLLMGGEKMSKSKTKDTSIWMPDYLNTYRPDPLRYYLTIHMPELHDTTFTWEEFFEKNNSELVGTYGNFIHRVMSFTFSNLGQFPKGSPSDLSPDDLQAIEKIAQARDEIGDFIDSCQFKNGLESLMALAQHGNRYFNSQKPWDLIKTDKARCAAVLHTSIRMVSALCVLSAPFLPHSAERLWKMLGNNTSVHAQKWDSAGETINEGARMTKPEILYLKLGEDEKKPGQNQGAMQAAKTPQPQKQPAPEQNKVASAPAAVARTTPEEELARLAIQVAKVVLVEQHPNADKLYKLTVDLGGGETRTSVAGLKKYYTPQELTGKTVIAITNLEPAILRGIQSNVMLFAAEAGEVVGALTPSRESIAGEKVCALGGKPLQGAPQLKFADFQMMDIRTGTVREVAGGKAVVDAGKTITVAGITDAALAGKNVVVICGSGDSGLILATQSGAIVTTDRDLPSGSKVR